MSDITFNIQQLKQDALDMEDQPSIDELEEFAYINCPICEAVNNKYFASIGQLGNVEIYQCRFCGINFESIL